MQQIVLYGIDAASGQGAVVWPEVAKTCAFGFEKVTQGTGYVNPYWTTAKSQLLGLKQTGQFVPGAYMFLEHGNAAAQADFFARIAGNLDGWLIVLDGEPSQLSSPDTSDLAAAMSRLRVHYSESQLAGYLPEWYWGPNPNFSEFDWLWASHYVNGSGTPEGLYAAVPDSWWHDYGGRKVQLLQFTSAASVPGVTGDVDASAFRGTFDQLKSLTMKSATPVPPVHEIGDTMYVFDQPQGKQIVLPVPSGATRVTLYAAPLPGSKSDSMPSIDVICGPSSEHREVAPTWEHQNTFDLVQNTQYIALNRLDNGNVPVTVQFS